MTLMSRFLTLGAWIGVTALVFCLYMIARFFQQKSGQRSYYQLFLVPLVLFLIASLYCTLPGNDFAVTPVADSLFFVAGVSRMTLGSYLFNLMTGGQK